MPLLFALLTLLLLTAAPAVGSIGKVQARARMAADGSDLRQIAQASLIYAAENENIFPVASDVWDYATLLAQKPILEEARMWQSRVDPGTEANNPETQILLPSLKGTPRKPDPAFRNLVLSIAIPVNVRLKNPPDTLPIAWTRGLQSDGTWAGHSPYGTRGGYIAFADGTVKFFKRLGSDKEQQLLRFDRKGTTVDILEALPPGASISEYKPTPEERAKWTEQSRTTYFHEHSEALGCFIFLGIVWGPAVFISIHRARHKKPGVLQVFIIPGFITFIAAIVMPTC